MKLADLSTKQIERARAIFDAALPYGLVAVKASLMTAAAESSFLLYANDGSTKRTDVSGYWRSVARQSMFHEHDAVAPKQPASVPEGTWDTTADSVGHFQQRPMFGYGKVSELMDPAESTRIFLRGSRNGNTRCFLESPQDMDLASRCQWTQGSEFPTGENYRPMEVVADQLIARFWWPRWFQGERMANYDDPDKWFGSKDGTVAVGDGSTREPIAQSISATNRAAYLMLPIVQGLGKVLDGLAGKVLDAIAAKRWQYGNQEHKPEKDRGTNNLFEAVQATNTYVYSPEFGLKALGERLAAIEAKLNAPKVDGQG